MSGETLSYKLRRIRRGGVPRVLDLFAGCGGLSLGFAAAGFELLGAVENDPIAIQSYAANLHRRVSGARLKAFTKPRDISEESPAKVAREWGLRSLAKSVDVIVGGPPCQAFARVGRAKLREVAAHPEAFRQDERSNLYLRYLSYVRDMRPLALLMENVPDVLNYGGHNVPQEMAEALVELGYACRYTMLNAAYYGVPQMRERMFLIAFHECLQAGVVFPPPTHWLKLPRGYEGTRSVALRTLYEASRASSDPAIAYSPAPAASKALPPAITAEQAIADLPTITAHLNGGLKRGTRRFDTLSHYPRDVSPSPYAVLMRSWPGFESYEGIRDHVIRSFPRDYAIFRRMRPGDQYPEAHRVAMSLLGDALRTEGRKGRNIKPSTAAYEALRRSIVPPYDPNKFPNKWRKMEADAPARTLMAHLGKDGYSHIHYDSDQARTISVREAARLQSFPDGFHFAGTMNPAFRQIGNAVPPLLANALAHAIASALGYAPPQPALVAQLTGGSTSRFRDRRDS